MPKPNESSKPRTPHRWTPAQRDKFKRSIAAKREGKPRVPAGLYAAARRLRRCVQDYVLENGGRIDKLAMAASSVCNGILGD